MKEEVIRILKELECPFQDEEEVINFEYEGERFAFIVEEGEPFIQLLNLDMMTISMDNHDEVQRVVRLQPLSGG